MSDLAPPSPLARAGVLAAGNFIVDHIKQVDHWPEEDGLARVLSESKHNGGGPYNLLKGLARLGAPFPLQAAGLLGTDEHGRWIREDCRAHGIDDERLRDTAAAATSYTDVISVATTGRRTFFHRAGANALLGPEHFDFAGCTARYFYLGYLLLLERLDAPGPDQRPVAADVLVRAREAGMITVVDCVSEASDRWRQVVAPVLPEVDILLANDFEAERLTGLAKDDAPDAETALRRAAEALLALGVRQHAVVHDPHGVAAASADGSCYWQPAVRVPPEEIAGCTGAGDALAAGVLYGLHEGCGLGAALTLGVSAAAASLCHLSASDGIGAVETVEALASRWGFR